MAGDWRKFRLGDLTTWASGGTPSKANPDFWNGDIPWISASSMKTPLLCDSDLKITKVGLENGSRLAESNSILLLVRGSELHKRIPVGVATRPVAFNQDVKALKVHGGLLPRYLFYWLVGNEATLLGKVEHTGIGAGKLDTEVLKNLSIRLPPLDEQKAIVSVLGALDDKIELNRRMNATLEEIARALFKSWFVDFDPVRAKLEGRQPPNLDPATAALFPERFQYVGDRFIPIGWQIWRIADICDINAMNLGKNDHLDPLEYVEISEVSRGDISNVAAYPRGTEPSRARRRLRHGDTVLSTVRPDRGSYFLAYRPPKNRVASTGFAVVTPKFLPWSLTHAALTLPDVFEQLGLLADGGAYPAVRPEIIGDLEIVLPNDTRIIEAFQRTCAPFFEQAEVNRAQSKTLNLMRDSMLPRLLGGNLSPASLKEGIG